MMAPAATSAGSSAKAGAFDVATLFVADKAARDEAALNLAAATKKEGVEFLGQIGFCDAVIKVSYLTTLLDRTLTDARGDVATDRVEKMSPILIPR